MSIMRLILWIVFLIAFAAAAVFFLRCNQFLGVVMKDPKLVEAIREAREMTEEIRACGEPPPDPWTVQPSVSKMDLDVYHQRKEVWDRCVQRMRDDGSSGTSSSSPAGSSRHELREFKESDRADF